MPRMAWEESVINIDIFFCLFGQQSSHTHSYPHNADNYLQRMIILERAVNCFSDFPVMDMSVCSIILDWNVVLFADANNKRRL